MNREKLNANMWKLYLIKSLSSFMLFIPVIVLFYQENGLSMKEVFLLQSLFSVSVLMLEVPTGYFSDVFGRKRSLIIGAILATIGFGIYAGSHGLWGFLLAEIVLGIGNSFVSGTDAALLYDTLLSLDKTHAYKKIEGRRASMGLFSESIASSLGGILAIVSLRFPLYCDVLVTMLVIPVALTLIEPVRQSEQKSVCNWNSMMKFTAFFLREHKDVKWLIVYSAIVSASTLTMFWFIQPYFTATGVPLGLFGIIFSVYFLTASFFSWHAHAVEKFLGRKWSLILLLIVPVAGYFLLSSLWFAWSGVFILLFYMVRGINDPVMLDYINGRVSSDVRATILSVKNLFGRLAFSAVGPFVGWISDSYSLKAALVSSGGIFLLLGLISLAFLRKHKAL